MISIEDYVGPHAESEDWTITRQEAAERLLCQANAMMAQAEKSGVVFRTNPATGTQISGQTFGGFRPQDCPQGASNSSHKEGSGVDLYDPKGEIDAWCLAHQTTMSAYDIYIEHPTATVGWSHWTTRAPRSGNQVFYP